MSPHRVVDSSRSTGFGILVFTLNILRRGIKERRSAVRRDARSTESSRTRTWYVLESYYCCTLLIERQVAPGVRRSV